MAMTTTTTESLLLDIFSGNPYYATSSIKDGGVIYTPINQPLSIETLADHLNGIVTLGSYPVIRGSDTVKWFGWDVDSTLDLEEARNIAKKIQYRLKGIPHVVEFSGRKGYHILIFLQELISATEAKKIGEWVRDREGCFATGNTHVEVFPKQDKIGEGYGNLIKIPLGIHPVTGQRSVFVDTTDVLWERGKTIAPSEALIRRATLAEVRSIQDDTVETEDDIAVLLAKYWTEGARHQLALYLAGYLVNEGWDDNMVILLFHKIMAIAGDEELTNREETARNTYAKFKVGKVVRGRQGLSEILPVSVMHSLIELATELRVPDTVAHIDEFRFNKSNAKIVNARMAADEIWSILHDQECKIFRTSSDVDVGIAYWYNAGTHLVAQERSDTWQIIINRRFGLNPRDSFSAITEVELHDRIMANAPILKVYNRTYWDRDNSKLYVNLGGPEVYILDGATISVGFNGDCGIFFRTYEDTTHKVVIPDMNNPIDAWTLTHDLSFETSEDSPAKPAEQEALLKAFILSIFFKEEAPTKPILLVTGDPGSGKTTAMRRFVKLFEGEDSDVLSLQIDKPDAFRVSLEKRSFLVLDNLEKSNATWFAEELKSSATGKNIELRALYSTSKSYLIKPECYIALTAISLPFADEALSERLLVLRMKKIEKQRAESSMQRDLISSIPGIWADLLKKLNNIICCLRDVKVDTPDAKIRLADFAAFCQRIKGCTCIDGNALNMGILAMNSMQAYQLKESSPAISILEDILRADVEFAENWHSINDYFDRVQQISFSRKMTIPWKTASALQTHFQAIASRLKSDYGADLKMRKDPSTSRETLSIKFRSNGK
jgi:hypothetical protein